ncbi:MAG: peptidase C45 acyl-coenzyme A:6-aminopenicillanic acid acyl-transferase [Verrucomicrobia bacterium]|nr:peptidase C45 acyl-coenzyme A:6-aminopenicillanic acid acyl-transferase [Verrucomicrobiota bacterium]
MRRVRQIAWLGTAAAGLALACGLASHWLFWSGYDELIGLLRDPAALRGQHVRLEVAEQGKTPRVRGSAELFAPAKATGFRLAVNYDNKPFELAAGAETHVAASKTGAHFAGGPTDFPESRLALAELADALPELDWRQRLGITLMLRPFITGVATVDGRWCCRIALSGGHALVALRDRLPREAQFGAWRVTVRRGPLAGAGAAAPTVKTPPERVEAGDIDRSLAAALRIATLQLEPVPREPDATRHEGGGSLEIKDGRRVLRLRGRAYDIGYQHGRLLAPNVRRLCERVVYGVGFYYSIEKGRWFLADAARLVERQRPFIAPEYAEELRGLADGAGLPLATVQAANIFPEFFHCSGAAVFGKATKGGTLLHARVLDYMTEVGLQDEAVLMAIEREGARRIVNVSYAGFIGSVTGMNEKQVAIGEMGGRGEGQWDGTPMSFLLRGALENSDTLEEALDYMRTKRRTCEYYYVVSDGKSRTARGVAATPEKFEVVAPGEAVSLLPDPVEDAVLLSAGDRYKQLVKRVRELHGRIGPEEFQRLIARPVAMRSNLHNAIFEPPTLTTWIAHATRHAPACDQPYQQYMWAELFGGVVAAKP